MSENEIQSPASTGLNRRSVVKGAAWSVPVIAAAIAAPAMAASPRDAGAFVLNGVCGLLGTVNPGFDLTAGPTTALPAGTIIRITSDSIADIGVFSLTAPERQIATVNVISPNVTELVLTRDLRAGTTLSPRTTLSIGVDFLLNAVVILPTGYIGTGSDPVGFVDTTLVLCSAG